MIKLETNSPLTRDLVRAAFLIKTPTLDETPEGFLVDEATVKDVLSHAAAFMREKKPEEKVPLTGNDRNSLDRVLKNCLGQGLGNSTESHKFLELVLENFDRVVECKEVPRAQLLKSEYYSTTDVPMGLEESNNTMVGSLLTFALAVAGYGLWNLGRIKLGTQKEDFYDLLLLPIKARNQVPPNDESPKLPYSLTYEWAFALWLALEFKMDAITKVVLTNVSMGKIRTKPSLVIDLEVERKALESVFDDSLDKVKNNLEVLIRNTLSDNPNKDVLRFLRSLYEVAHGSQSAEFLKIFGLRNYAALLSKGSKEVDKSLYEAMKEVAISVRLQRIEKK